MGSTGASAGLTLALAVPATFVALLLPRGGLVLVAAAAAAVAGRFAALRIWR